MVVLILERITTKVEVVPKVVCGVILHGMYETWLETDEL